MVEIEGTKIGDGEPCYVTFEAGPTHDGLESALKLTKLAASSGANAIKFQIFDPGKLVANKKQMFSYGVLEDRETGKVKIIEEPLYDIFVRRTMSPEEWRQVKTLSDELGLAFFATVGFDEDIDLLVKLDCHSIKIASADVNHYPLLRSAARTGMCIQIDTGMSTLGEIEAAIDVILSEGNSNIIIHQCPSDYPAHLDSINLNIIKTLKRMYPFPIAFSDHTPGATMDIAAVALGANLVEKTITLDRMTPSVEHVMSLEPQEMVPFIRTIRDVEVAMGGARRRLHDVERDKRDAVRRSVFLKGDAEQGQTLNTCDIEYRRPGYGIQPDQFDALAGFRLSRDLPAGHMIKLEDLAGI